MSPSRLAALLLAVLPAAVWGQAVPTDLAGDPLPPGAVARIGSVRLLPRPYLQQVFFTPDGSAVIGRGGDNVIDFWDAGTGRPIGELRDPDLMNFWVDLSPDGKRLALYGHDRRGQPAPDTTLRLYDLATRKVLWESVIDDVYHFGYHRVVFSRDGKKLIAGSAVDVRVWDAASGKELARQNVRLGHTGLVLSPDGKTVAFGEGNAGLYLWDWESGGPPRKVPLVSRPYFHYLAFSPDGKTVYASDGQGQAHGYDVATGAPTGQADESVVRWRRVSPDGKTVAVADHDRAKNQGSVVLREAASGKEVGRLSSGSLVISDGRWSPDGTRIAGTTAYRAWVWDVKTGKALGSDVPAHTAALHSLAFASDGRLVTSGQDATVRTWDSATGRERLRFNVDHPMGMDMTLSPDGDLVAGSPEPNAVRVWEAKTGREVFKLAWGTGRYGGVFRVRFAADGQTLLTYGHDFRLRVFDTLTGKLKSERKIRPAALGPETDDDERQAWEFKMTHRTVDVSADGGTLVIGTGKEVAVYATDTGKERFKFEADPRHVDTLVLSPDGKRLATAGYGPPPPPALAAAMIGRNTPFHVVTWDLARTGPLARPPVPASAGSYRLVAFTPDGKRLVTGSGDDLLRFWDAATGAAVGVIELPRPASRVAFGGDRRLAVGFADPTVLVYELAAALKPAPKE